MPPNGAWTRPPFSGLVEDGFIWGRGALDDKVSVLSLLEAVEFLLDAGFKPRRTIYLAFGHDEEIDGTDGAVAIAEHFKKTKIRFAFVLDEGSPLGVGLVPGIDAPVALIGVAEKGYLSVELTAATSGGHSSMPSRASAVRVLAEALLRLWHDADKGALGPPMTANSGAARRPAPGLRAAARGRQPLALQPDPGRRARRHARDQRDDRDHRHGHGAGGGTGRQRMPSHARAVINFRLLPGTTVEQQLRASPR